MSEDKEKFDSRKIRCPMISGEVKFRYCRTMNNGKLCDSVLVCWEDRISYEDLADACVITDEDLADLDII